MVLRTLAMPADTNANGDIFGGWLMSQMDIGGAIMAKEIAQWSRGDRAGGWDDIFTSGRRWRRGVLLRPLREARQHLGDNQYRSVGEKKFLQNRLASATRRRKRCLSTLPLIIRENHVLCQRNKKVPGLPGT